jgi:hypothetical protein
VDVIGVFRPKVMMVTEVMVVVYVSVPVLLLVVYVS